MGSNVCIFKVQNGEYGGAGEPQKLQNFVRPFQISSWMMSKPHNRCFPIHFLSGIKICKMGTTIVWGFAYVKPAVLVGRWGHYRPHLEEKFSRFSLTITWPILVHLAWPRAHFDHTREGYKMISSEIHQTRRLPVTNPSNDSNGSDRQ